MSRLRCETMKTGVTDVELKEFLFADSGTIPNNPRLPLLVYKAALGATTDEALARAFEKQIGENAWDAAWRYGVYSFAHYHSTAHEFLGVYRGSAKLKLGHSSGIELTVGAGDVLVIPAGVGHQNLGSSDDFHVVGGYPRGEEADLLRGAPAERIEAQRRIAAVPPPKQDPLFGPRGPLMSRWHLI